MNPLVLTETGFSQADFEYRVRRQDGTWLTRPERLPDALQGNADPWSRRIPDGWSFDTPYEARRAALSHGAEKDSFTIIQAPRRPGEWLAKSRPAPVPQSR